MMEEVFHHVRIDKEELKRVKEKASKVKPKLVETEEFIPFDFSDNEADPRPEPKQDAPRDKRKAPSPKKDGPKPATKRLRIDTLLYQGMPWIDTKRKYSFSTAERLHQEIVDFANWMGPCEQERSARLYCIQKVKDLVAELWPDATLETFGSIRTQFYVPSSDIDLVIMQPAEQHSAKPPLKRLARQLEKAQIAEKGTIQVISKARVPIIKYIDRITAYPVDISFNTTSGTESADLVAKYSSKYPALRPLTLVLKQFLEMRGLNEVYTGGIGSYTVTCLVLSFLQTHPLVQGGLIRPHENLGMMLLEMLELYGRHFNYEQVGISVQPAVPGEFYFDKQERGWLNDARPGLLSIEDPQNPENDISKGSFSFHNVRQSFDHGFQVLLGSMLEYEKYFLDYNRGHPNAKIKPSELSILGSVVRLSDGVLRHRQFVRSLK